MPSWAEALAAIQGIKRLIRFDAGFVAWFDRSSRGALRSFGLMLPIFPCVLVYLFLGANLRPELGGIHLVAVTLTYYVLSWILLPLLLIALGRLLERESQAIGTITFCNWFSAFLVVGVLPLHLLAVAFADNDIVSFAIFFVVIASLVLEAFAFRVLLGFGYTGAILLTIFDYILSRSLHLMLISPLYQPPPV
jgi:hypothetical protein